MTSQPPDSDPVPEPEPRSADEPKPHSADEPEPRPAEAEPRSFEAEPDPAEAAPGGQFPDQGGPTAQFGSPGTVDPAAQFGSPAAVGPTAELPPQPTDQLAQQQQTATHYGQPPTTQYGQQQYGAQPTGPQPTTQFGQPAPPPGQPQAPAPMAIPQMNVVWSQEDPRHPAASTRSRWRYDPFWWVWPVGGLATSVFLAVVAYGLTKVNSDVAGLFNSVTCIGQTFCTPVPQHVNGNSIAIWFSCAGCALMLAFLLPHRWVWLWLRVPLTLFGVASAILLGGAMAPSL